MQTLTRRALNRAPVLLHLYPINASINIGFHHYNVHRRGFSIVDGVSMVSTGLKAANPVISVTRNWAKGHIEGTIDQLISSPNEEGNTLNEASISKRDTILKALNKQLDDIKMGVDLLRNKDYEMAKKLFIEALRWPDKQEHFRKCIIDSFHLCQSALGTVPFATDKIQIYALLISSGFIFHSDYGNDPLSGLRHIHNVLRDMNHDEKLRKDISSALGSKVYWNGEQKELLRSVVVNSVQISAFIVEIQKLISKLDSLSDADSILNDNIKLALKPLKHSVKKDGCDYRALLKRDWLPLYWTGFYFGDIGSAHGNGGCKYSVIEEKHLQNLIGFSKHQMLVPKDGEAFICETNFQLDVWCKVSVPPRRNNQKMKPVIDPKTESVNEEEDHTAEIGNAEVLLNCSVAFDTKIKDLRRMIGEHPENSLVKFGTTPEFCLYFNGEWLEDDKLISDYSIFPGDHLILEQELEMEYHRGRGYTYVHSPDRLLDGKNNTSRYLSKYGLPINEDWIIFKRTAAFNIKHVMIRNYVYYDASAIKSIVISTSSEDVDDQYIKLMEIKDIKQGGERQWFAVKEETGKEAKHKINFIRIDILENYGHENYNAFSEFGIFGVSE